MSGPAVHRRAWALSRPAPLPEIAQSKLSEEFALEQRVRSVRQVPARARPTRIAWNAERWRSELARHEACDTARVNPCVGFGFLGLDPVAVAKFHPDRGDCEYSWAREGTQRPISGAF